MAFETMPHGLPLLAHRQSVGATRLYLNPFPGLHSSGIPLHSRPGLTRIGGADVHDHCDF